MAYINVRYPVYYATLQSEYGLTLAQINDLASRNKVFALELGKVETLKTQGNTDNQIINYFTSQGYNSVQMQEVRTYLETRNKVDSTGKTGKEKLDNTLATIQKISGTTLPILGDLAKIFGIGGNSLNPVTVPNLANYTPVSKDGYTNFVVDNEKGEIKSGTGVDVTPPKVGVSSLPFGLTTENLLLIALLIFAVYFFAKSSNSNSQSSTINSKK